MNEGFSKIMNKIYMFYSVDLIDSTKIKTNLMDWQNEFYDFIAGSIFLKDDFKKREKIDIDIFKILGDEVIYYIKLEDYSKIYNVFKILNLEIIKFQEEYLKKEIKLKFKSTSWITHTKDKDKDKVSMPIFRDDNKIFDFIGCQMDEGFRIAKSFSHVVKQQFL